MKSLKFTLDRLYNDYNFEERKFFDPIEFPHQYKRPEDIEVSAFIASCFAYGKVDLFKPVVKNILSVMGKSPYDFLLDFNPGKHGKLFADIKYRFNKNEDIICLFLALAEVFKKYGSIESAFKRRYTDSDLNIGNGLTGLIDMLLRIDTSAVYGRDMKSNGFLQFFPSPSKGSACKRMNLFLRWMIRDRDIDFGIWKGIPKNKLVIPLDTHIGRISKCLGFTKRSSQDWKMAVEITEALKTLDPEDPLKYDFALCHQGISKVCNRMNCKECNLFGKIPAGGNII
ncbi:MAG: TIGR02757 family protein [Nitrospirae bacterium]|nr:TIGR02757 family protein [Nitrospirota bacterium]